MRRLSFGLNYARLDAVDRSEHLLMDCALRDPQGNEIVVPVFQERRWTTYIKVGIDWNGEFLQTRKVPTPAKIEVVARPVIRVWIAVRDSRVASGNSGKELPDFVGEDMLGRIARGMNPPYFSG